MSFAASLGNVRFFNRPVGVKRFQATHRCSVDVAHGLAFPPISDLAWLSCCCRDLFPGPAELGAVNPDAVHDHSQPAGQAMQIARRRGMKKAIVASF
jgi:hypothetical protein